jgi:thiol-disulfide isomerase/thioredoxin
VSSKAHTKASKSERAAARRAAAVRRKRIRNGVLAGVGVAAVMVVALLMIGGGGTATGITEPEAWDLPVLGGEDRRLALADLDGKPTVAVFFASWCAECWDELPGLAVLSEELGGEVDFVGINIQAGGRGGGMAESTGIDVWPLVRDVGGNDGRGLSTAFGARGMPLTVIYSADGTVADVQLGAQLAPQLRAKLVGLFGIGA